MAEDFTFDERLGDGGAVYGDEGTGFAGAEVVEGAGDEFLAGAAFAGDEHGDVGGGDLLDEAEDFAHGTELPTRTPSTPVSRRRRRATSSSISCLALAGGVGENGAQAGGVDGLLQEVVSAELHGIDGEFEWSPWR